MLFCWLSDAKRTLWWLLQKVLWARKVLVGGLVNSSQVSSAYLPRDQYLGLKVLSVTWAQRVLFTCDVHMPEGWTLSMREPYVCFKQTNPHAFFFFFFKKIKCELFFGRKSIWQGLCQLFWNNIRFRLGA